LWNQLYTITPGGTGVFRKNQPTTLAFAKLQRSKAGGCCILQNVMGKKNQTDEPE